MATLEETIDGLIAIANSFGAASAEVTSTWKGYRYTIIVKKDDGKTKD